MKKLVYLFALVVLTTRAFCQEKELTIECYNVAPTRTETARQTYSLKNPYLAKIVAKISVRNHGTSEQPRCTVDWAVFAYKSGSAPRRILHLRAESDAGELGVDPPVFSRDNSKLMVDFWEALGDYTDHRPAVYDFLTRTGNVRVVGERVTRNLPSCDYSTELEGVTNDGNVMIHVPKSNYVDEGCPDQGLWSLNMKTGTIIRMKKMVMKKDDAVSQKTNH